VTVRPNLRRLIVVLDTNALVRVALAKSPLARSLRLAFEHGDFILLVSGSPGMTPKIIPRRIPLR